MCTCREPTSITKKHYRTRDALPGRGFDQVSIIHIAAAAQVAVQTVYNYFPAKADLVFDEAGQITGDLVHAVRQRAPGESALSAIRGYFASIAARVGDRRPPEPSPRFRRLVRDSPTLRSYQREVFARFEQALSALLAEETGAAPDAVEPFIAAAALVSVFRVNLEGRSGDTAPPGERAGRALDLLQRGLGDYAQAPAPPARSTSPDARAAECPSPEMPRSGYRAP
jgi:AcrR family transcriptional regulator